MDKRISCLVISFNEESNIPREAYTLLKNIRLEETFEGLNGVRYKHIYFVGLLQKPKIIDIFQRFTPMQRREISAIRWMTWSECEREIRKKMDEGKETPSPCGYKQGYFRGHD